MKPKIFAAFLLLSIIALLPLSAQETSTPLLSTNTPTRSTADVAVPTLEPGAVEQVSVDLSGRAVVDGQRFQIIGFEFEKTTNTLQSVRITVQNISDAPASGRVWYLLAPPGTTEPWNRALYTADEQLITDLPSQETRTFTFSAPPPNVIGEFDMSAWVHQSEADGSSNHADGVGYEQTILLAPRVYLTVENVDFLTAQTGDTVAFVTLNIRNFTGELTEVAFSYTLAAPDDPTPWETGVFTLPFQPVMLMPGQSLRITTRDTVTLPGGTLQVIGWLQERVGEEMQFRNNDPYP